MREQFLDRSLTFDEHETFGPVIDELVFYSKIFYEGGQEAPDFNQANTLMRFGSAYQVSDMTYWRMFRHLMD